MRAVTVVVAMVPVKATGIEDVRTACLYSLMLLSSENLILGATLHICAAMNRRRTRSCVRLALTSSWSS